MSKLIDIWSGFTDSLNSRGGTIALLFVSCVGLGALMIHIMHHGDNGQAASAIIATFSAFTGALLIALTNKEKPNGNGGQPPAGNGK
jgi:FtsH-binding integral membrane protein